MPRITKRKKRNKRGGNDIPTLKRDINNLHNEMWRRWKKGNEYDETIYKKNNYKIIHTKDYKGNQWKEITKNSSKKDQEIINDLPMGKCLITI